MPAQGEHCPFLNRADQRCSDHFSLDHLGQALSHCFGRYQTCPVYLELLAERKVRRSTAHASPALVQIRIPSANAA
jgi:hypothetical protein